MNKGSIAAANPVKTPVTAKSAWAKGPPQQQQQPATANGPSNPSRSNTPNPPTSGNGTPSHSRRPSAFSPAVAVKGGQPRPSEFVVLLAHIVMFLAETSAGKYTELEVFLPCFDSCSGGKCV